MRAVQLDHVEARPLGPPPAWTKSALTRSISARSICARHLAVRVVGERRGQTIGQAPSSNGRRSPSHISLVDALRPAWPIWRQNFPAELAWTKSTMRRHAASCASLQRPVQPGVMRASAETLVISVKISPAPPIARRHSGRGASRRGRRPWPNTCTSARRRRGCGSMSRSRNGWNIGGAGLSISTSRPCARTVRGEHARSTSRRSPAPGARGCRR